MNIFSYISKSKIIELPKLDKIKVHKGKILVIKFMGEHSEQIFLQFILTLEILTLKNS